MIIIRHCAPNVKYHKRYIGHSDIEIDKSLFDFSKTSFLRDMKFDFIYSSPLKRCAQTLEQLNFSYQLDDRLKEVKFKDFVELKNFEEVATHPDFTNSALSSYENWFEFICDEPICDFKNRVQNFLNDLPKDKDILICTHKGVIDMICNIKNIKMQKIDYLDFIEV